MCILGFVPTGGRVNCKSFGCDFVNTCIYLSIILELLFCVSFMHKFCVPSFAYSLDNKYMLCSDL